MKKINVILQVVIIAALAVLYVLYFTGKPAASHKPGKGKTDTASVNVQPGKLAYINIDTLLTHYEYYQDLRNALLDKQEQKGTELQNQFKQWEKEASSLEDQRQKLLITRKTYEESSQRLLARRDQLMQAQESASQELMEEEQVMNRKVLYRILDYLKVYNANEGYQYIFSNTFGGNILLAAEDQDITWDVLEGLNQVYLSEKKDTK